MKKHLSYLTLLFVVLLPATLLAVQPSIVSNSVGPDGVGAYRLKFMSQTFTTDSQAWSNLNITLALFNYNATSSGSFSLGIYEDSAGSIGSLIGGFTSSNSAFFTTPTGLLGDNLSDYQNISFQNNAVTLSSNTTYWVALNNDLRQNFGWAVYDGSSKSGSGSYGLAWLGDSSASASDLGGNLFATRVTGTATAVPEPSTYALMGLGALVLMIAARRKRASV